MKIFDSTSDHEDLEQLEMKKEIETSNENENAQKENIMNRLFLLIRRIIFFYFFKLI